MKSVILKKIHNVRDIGGYNTENGRIKYNIIYRGECPSNVCSHDKKILDSYNFNVIDIRSEEEKIKKESYFKKNYNDAKLIRTRWPESEEDIPNTYMEVINDTENIKNILKLVMHSEKPIYLNCNLGKDRTGCVVMIIMLMLGVNEDDIIADYALSDVYLRENYYEFHKNNPDSPKYLGRAKREYMEKTLELFKEKYKDINNYLKILNIDEGEIESFKDKVIERI